MYQVLLPLDGDEDRALAQAEYVAAQPGAAEEIEAILLFVFTGGEEDTVPQELRQFKSATRVGSVRRATEHLEEAGVDVTVTDGSGDAADDIIATAQKHDVDEIVMGGRKRSPAGKAIFGSVTQSVIRSTDLPVVVTGSGTRAR